MSIIDIFLLVLIIVGILVGVYLILTLKKITSTLDFVRNDLESINNKLEPILENVKTITDKAVNISDETEKRVLDLSNTIQNVRSTVSKFSFKGRSTQSKRAPIQELLSNLTAISKGISAFWQKLNN